MNVRGQRRIMFQVIARMITESPREGEDVPEGFDAGAAYILQGQVQLGEPLPQGGQPIAIAWDLYGPQGNHLGNIAQENLIEPGSLDGAWGEVAVFAAMGAVEGILALLAAIPLLLAQESEPVPPTPFDRVIDLEITEHDEPAIDGHGGTVFAEYEVEFDGTLHV